MIIPGRRACWCANSWPGRAPHPVIVPVTSSWLHWGNSFARPCPAGRPGRGYAWIPIGGGLAFWRRCISRLSSTEASALLRCWMPGAASTRCCPCLCLGIRITNCQRQTRSYTSWAGTKTRPCPPARSAIGTFAASSISRKSLPTRSDCSVPSSSSLRLYSNHPK